jgi:dihydrofolate reductase
MGKLIAWNIASVDGCFEGPEPWDLALHQTVWGDELEAFSKTQLEDAEALIFGRKTFEGMASYWANETGTIADQMNAIKKYAVSEAGTNASWNNSTVIGTDVVNEIAALKKSAARTLYVFGSADLLSTLLDARLVDEYRLCIAPLILGRGNLLFKPSDTRIDLRLLKSQPLRNGGIVLHYGVQNA